MGEGSWLLVAENEATARSLAEVLGPGKTRRSANVRYSPPRVFDEAGYCRCHHLDFQATHIGAQEHGLQARENVRKSGRPYG